MHDYKVGDRVKVVGTMQDDPYPLELGTTGTIRRIAESVGQIDVRWDNGRSLMILVPEDLGIIAPA